jgi:Sap, sulfolipid-1-addressing protein
MPLIQLISIIISIAILDSFNPSAIILTISMLGSGTKFRNILLYIFGIFCTYFGIGAVLMIGYQFFGSGFKIDLSFVGDYFNKPPLWTILTEFIAGISLLIYTLIHSKKTSLIEKKPKSNTVVQKSMLSFFMLGVVITGVESTTALPYFGAISTLFLGNKGVLTNLVLLCIYNIYFILPALILIGIRLYYKEKFDLIIVSLKKLSYKYGPKVVFWGGIVFSAYLIFDAALLLIYR